MLITDKKYDNFFKNNNINNKWVYGTSMRGDRFATQKKLFELAKNNNFKIAYNPSPYVCRFVGAL